MIAREEPIWQNAVGRQDRIEQPWALVILNCGPNLVLTASTLRSKPHALPLCTVRRFSSWASRNRSFSWICARKPGSAGYAHGHRAILSQLCTKLDAQLETSGHSLAAADEQKLDTARIHKAIDKCGKGRGVLLHVNEANNAFLSGPLELKPDVALIVGVGVTLFASRDPALFATSPGSCGIVSHTPGPRGCKPLISVDHAPGSAIMGDGVIDARGGEKMLGSQYSWWDLAEQARAGGGQQVPRIIVADYSDNFTLYRITLKNSPNFHVVYNHGNGFTVWGLKIDTPKRLARNTDGVDPGAGSKNITITHSYIRTGDDNVAIKGGTGGADQHDREPQSLLLGPWHVDRKRDERWREQDSRLRSFCSMDRTMAFASNRTARAAA